MSRAAAATASVLAATVLTVLTASSVSADPDLAEVSPLELTGFEDITYAAGTDQLFISQGDDGVVVADAQGRPVREMAGLGATSGLVMDDAAGEVYVGRPDARQVSVVDVRSFEVEDLATPDLCPHDLAKSGAWIVFSSSCPTEHGPDEQVAAIDTRSGTVVRDLLGWNTPRRAKLITSPWAPGSLLLLGPGTSPGAARIYDVEAGDELRLVERAELDWGSVPVDGAFTPDGEGVVVAASGGRLQRYSTADLSEVGPTYERLGSYGSKGLAFRADGALASTHTSYRPGETAAQNQLDFNGASPVGFAWGPTLLYAVTVRTSDGISWFHELQVVHPRDASSVSVDADRRILAGDSSTLRMELATTSANRRVVVTAVRAGGESQVVARPWVGPAGASLQVSPLHSTRYVVSYPGDEVASPATDFTHVEVEPTVTARFVTPVVRHNGLPYARSGQTVRIRARIEAFPGACVNFWLVVRPLRQWYDRDSAKCVPIPRDGVVEIGVRTRAGQKPHLHKVVVVVPSSPDSRRSEERHLRIQFCPKAPTCRPPDVVWNPELGIPASGPPVWLVR